MQVFWIQETIKFRNFFLFAVLFALNILWPFISNISSADQKHENCNIQNSNFAGGSVWA
jgi:uncharacterized membrane protein